MYVDWERSWEKWLDDVTDVILPGILAVWSCGSKRGTVGVERVKVWGSGQLAAGMMEGELRAGSFGVGSCLPKREVAISDYDEPALL